LWIALLLVACQQTPPVSQPTDFKAFSASASTVTLTWTPVSGVSEYVLERKTASGSYSQIATPPGPAASYADTGLSGSTVYTYRIRTSGSQGNGSEATLTTNQEGSGLGVSLQDVVTTGLSNPLFLTHAGDGGGDLYIVEKGGKIRLVEAGALRSLPFLDISNASLDPDRLTTDGERGLLGLAFSPDYATNGYFYVYYTNTAGNLVIARYTADRTRKTADPNTERVLLTIPHPSFSNHNGGWLAFGPDGMLYAAIGDGGGGGDPNNNGQNLGSLLGKVIRIDVSAEESDSQRYRIPADNPFVGQTNVRPEIWAYGLRNPWRSSFDRQTGDLWIADVGQGVREEVNFAPGGGKGLNFGWNRTEGDRCYNGEGCSMAGLTPPVWAYTTGGGDGRAVTGGYVYRGGQTALQGRYFFSDSSSGLIWALHKNPDGTWTRTQVATGGAGVVSFGEDEAGELYVVNIGGWVKRIVASP
jgi:glucose/arabinose dehydrogenase